PDGSAQFGVDTLVSGAFAASWRSRYLAEGTRRERATRDLLGDLGTVDLGQGKTGVDVNDLEDVEQSVKLRAHGKAPTLARREGDPLSMPSGPAPHLVPEYASASLRRLEVNLPALTTREDEWVIKLPQGMKVSAAPTPDQKDTPYGRYAITVEQ